MLSRNLADVGRFNVLWSTVEFVIELKKDRFKTKFRE